MVDMGKEFLLTSDQRFEPIFDHMLSSRASQLLGNMGPFGALS
jgi:hypothetical protein